MNSTKTLINDFTTADGMQFSKKPLISDQLYLFIMFISLGVICQIISVFGTLSNVINIIIFVKQGFTDHINICLLALTVSDLCSLVAIMWSNLCFTPAFANSNIQFVSYEVQLISGTWPHTTFTRTTGWITAFISFERCMCVTLPLKVKTIFTPMRHVAAVVLIYIVTVGSCFSLGYVCIGLGWRFYPERNQTLIGLVPRLDDTTRNIIIFMSYAINGIFMPMTSFVLVVVSTIVLVIKLNQHAAWRHSTSSTVYKTNQSSSKDIYLASRDKKAANMVVIISAIFILCFIPAVCIFIAGYIEPQFAYDGVYRNLFLTAFSVSFTAEAVNSSTNIIIYLAMNTKYRHTFCSMLKLNKVGS